jgi:hypothetical protein
MSHNLEEAKKELKNAGFRQGKSVDMPTFITLQYSGLMLNGCELNLYISYNDNNVRTEGVVSYPNGNRWTVYDVTGVDGLFAVIADSKPKLLRRSV